MKCNKMRSACNRCQNISNLRIIGLQGLTPPKQRKHIRNSQKERSFKASSLSQTKSHFPGKLHHETRQAWRGRPPSEETAPVGEPRALRSQLGLRAEPTPPGGQAPQATTVELTAGAQHACFSSCSAGICPRRHAPPLAPGR